MFRRRKKEQQVEGACSCVSSARVAVTSRGMRCQENEEDPGVPSEEVAALQGFDQVMSITKKQYYTIQYNICSKVQYNTVLYNLI